MKKIDFFHRTVVACCQAVANGAACTCWVPVYNGAQEPLLMVKQEPIARSKKCRGCSCKPDDLTMFCHHGMRKIIAYEHKPQSGKVQKKRRAAKDEFSPPVVDGIPYLLSGAPADYCVGWVKYLQQLQKEAGIIKEP